MHIAINTIPTTGGHSRRGIGLYTKSLIEALVKFEPSHTYTFFTKVSEIHKQADVIHYPFFDPFFLTLPWSVPKPMAVTVHDLIPIVYAKHFPLGYRGQVKWQIQKNLLRRNATIIITDSQSSKSDIEEILRFPQDRVFCVLLAPRKMNASSDVRKKYKLNSKFILYVGDVNWNKNIPGLLDSVHNLELICVGKAFVDHQMKMPKNTRILGFVSDEDLAGLYTKAEALVYPSFAEGFGFPILEAMEHGCPVVTSNVSSLAEIAGPSILVDPYKPEDIRKGLDVVRSFSNEKRHELITKGFEWVRRFTWEKVARETVAVYEKTLNYHSGI